MLFNTRSSLLLLLFISLAGCKSGSPLFEAEDWEFIDELTLVATPAMNNKTPLKVDVVIVKDTRIAEQIAKLTARQYMKQRKQLKYDHPQHIKIRSFELIPGTSIIMPLKYQRNEVAAGFIFAQYNNQKTNRWNVFSSDCVKVELLESTVRITSHKWKEAPKVQEHNRQNDGVIVLS